MRQESCTRSCVSWLASLALHTNRGSPPSPVCTAVSHAVCPTVHAFPCRQRIHVHVVSARSLAALRPSEPSFHCPTPWYGPPSRRPRYLWKLASLATTPASPAFARLVPLLRRLDRLVVTRDSLSFHSYQTSLLLPCTTHHTPLHCRIALVPRTDCSPALHLLHLHIARPAPLAYHSIPALAVETTRYYQVLPPSAPTPTWQGRPRQPSQLEPPGPAAASLCSTGSSSCTSSP